MIGGKDRFGACERCEKHERLSFAKDAKSNQFRWLCRSCSKPGRSTAAELSEIDRKQAELLREGRRERLSSGAIRILAPPKGGPILVVEDDPSIRESVCMILEDEGFPTVSAANGKAAFDVLRTLDPLPRLILLDLMMPVMNGWEFYELISRARDSGVSAIPVIIMSAQESEPGVSSLTMLRKPLRLEQLLAKVNEVCLSIPPPPPAPRT